MNHLKMIKSIIFDELERFGKINMGKKRYSHEYNAFKDSWQLFLERGTRFTNQPLPQLARNSVREGRVKIIKQYPDWYIKQESRRFKREKKKAETEDVPF